MVDSMKKYIQSLDYRYKIVLITSLLVGLFSQGMGLFNKYSYRDDTTLFDVGNTIILGRWMLDVLEKVERLFYGDGHYSMPTFNGFVAILFVALATCVIVKLLDIKNDFLCFVIAGIMVSFPVITSLFGYVFTIHFYMLAVFMGIEGVSLICEDSPYWKKVVGIILAGFSIGIYQAYIPMYLTLTLMFFFKYVYENSKSIKEYVLKAVGLAICTVLYMAVYFVMNKIYLTVYNVQLADYQGISSMGKSSLGEYIHRVVVAYKEFFVPTAKNPYYMYSGTIRAVYYLVMLLTVAYVIKMLVEAKGNISKQIFMGICIILFPLCSNFVFVMADMSVTHSLMVYSQVFVFIMLAFSADKIELTNTKGNITKRVALVLLSFTILMYCRYDNRCYLKADLMQQQAISYFTTMVTQIKSLDGYNDDMPVVFCNRYQIDDKSWTGMPELRDIKIEPYGNLYDYLNNYRWYFFMNDWCGYEPVVESDIDNPILDTEEYQQMPHYPDDGSIKIIDEKIIVKF